MFPSPRHLPTPTPSIRQTTAPQHSTSHCPPTLPGPARSGRPLVEYVSPAHYDCRLFAFSPSKQPTTSCTYGSGEGRAFRCRGCWGCSTAGWQSSARSWFVEVVILGQAWWGWGVGVGEDSPLLSLARTSSVPPPYQPTPASRPQPVSLVGFSLCLLASTVGCS